MKNIAIVGAGYWGKNLTRVFNKLGALKTICDSDKAVLKREKKLWSVETTTDFSALLSDKDIKAVVIATPAISHYQFVKKALKAGKDVFVEKPLALKVKDGKELVELAKKEKRILMVGHLLNYHPGIIKLKDLIKKGSLGEIHYISSNRLNFGKLRREENVLWSFAPHDISIILSILGFPKKISAYGKAYLQRNNFDITLSFLEFNANKGAHVFVSWLNPFKEQKLSVIGSKKMAVFDGVKNELTLYSHKINKSPLEAVKIQGENVKFVKEEPLFKEAKHFIECIKLRKKPLTDGKEALNVLKVLEACHE